MRKVIFICLEMIRVAVMLTRPISDYVLSFFYHALMGRTKKLPPIDNKILLYSAVELAEKIRKRQISCEEVVRAYIERSKAVNPYINAVVDDRYVDAVRDAQEVDKMLAKGNMSEDEIARQTPLLGVPFSCKEAMGVKGLAQTSGLYRAKGRVATKDHEDVILYKKAGAIPVTVTNVPEICMWWESSNMVFGTTTNPYDHTRTAGGSTGGEGALIGAAGALIGIGSDIGGSIRIPSSFCGIYGHKPSRGVLPNLGTYPYDDMPPKGDDKSYECENSGPMCRYVQDLPVLLKALDAKNQIRLEEKVDFRKVNIYYMEQLPGLTNAPSTDIKRAIRKAVAYFKEEFSITPKPLFIKELKNALPIWASKLTEYNMTPMEYYLAGEGRTINLTWELCKKIVGLSNYSLPTIIMSLTTNNSKDQEYQYHLEQYKEIERRFMEIFQEDAILLIPTHPQPAPHIHSTIPLLPNVGYTCIFNTLGFPSTNIPAGLSNGLPFGIQAVSAHGKDHLSVATAIELDKLFGGWKSPSTISI